MLWTISAIMCAALATDEKCLTPAQDKDLKTSMMSLDATLQVTSTALSISAMWKTGQNKTNLLEAAKIISTVDTDLTSKITGIAESTCGTCTGISKAVGEVMKDLENTMVGIDPQWKSNPIYNSVVTAVNMIVELVPGFCPSSAMYVDDDAFEIVQRNANGTCLNATQDRELHTSIMAIDATLKITVTSLDIAAMWKNGTVKEQLLNSSRIISAVDKDLVEKMTGIVEKTCGTCSDITKEVGVIIKDLENTMGAVEPQWKKNPIFTSVVSALNTIMWFVPGFCPSAVAKAAGRALAERI